MYVRMLIMYVCMCVTVLSVRATQAACKYITDPVLFYQDDVGGYVKMDIRYVLLLKCVQPLELYANKSVLAPIYKQVSTQDNQTS